METENLRSILVNPGNEVKFYKYIGNDYAKYFFFHADYAQYPEDTTIYMALDKADKIKALLLNWKDRRIQLRGSIKELEFLLSDKKYSPTSITGFNIHKPIIAKYFPKHTKEIALYRMAMGRREHKDFEKYTFDILSDDHIEDIVSLMHIADPIYWGSRKPEDILIDDNNIYFGIFDSHKLICITAFWKYQAVGYITIVGTHPNYRNNGYASSLVSSVIKDLFREKDICLITVRVNNPPAIHTYKKLGFTIQNIQYSFEEF